MLLFESNLSDKINNIWGKISEIEHCYEFFVKENFRLFPNIFFKYLPSPLYLIIVNDKINSL